MSSKYIIKVSEKFPFKVDPGELGDEWCLLKSEQEIFDKMKTFSREQSDVSRVEYFWREVFKVQRDTNLKYGNIAKVVKACLSLSHGSAEVERGFSASNNILTPDKSSLSLRTLNARLNIRDGLTRYNYQPHLFVVPQVLIDKAKVAYKSYQTYLENQRKQKEEEERRILEKQNRVREEKERLKKVTCDKQTIQQLEDKLKRIRNDEKSDGKELDLILKEGTERLKKAISEGDINGAKVAQCLLDSYQKMKSSKEVNVKAAVDLETHINKRKNNLISTYIAKKSKILL